MDRGRFRLGCDIGGTFTDFVLLDDETGEIRTHKCLTTPGDPSDAIITGFSALEESCFRFTGELDEVIHGTTLVINAIIERKGARTGLLTTCGFRDVLELGREIRYAPYDVFAEFPEPLVPRRLRKEVDERIGSDGRILIALDPERAERQIDELIREEVDSIAICLLNSFENPVHERTLDELVRKIAPHISVSTSCEVLPQIKEYERTSTTVTNAYVKPLTENYLSRLEARLGSVGFDGKLYIMLSSGGITSVETAARFPVRIIESGPTAAVIAGQYYGKHFGIPELFCFDMGGTTAKSCLIQKGEAGVVPTFEVGRVQRFMKGSGLTIQVPVVDLMEIGAGGGSIAKVSRMRTLQVGPRSSGAMPGPICYGRGGTEPCVTDADLLLGYLDAGFFLGGEMPLDAQAARAGIEERIAKPLKVEPLKAIWGIHDLINETMAAAARTHIAEKGGNPELVTVVAFGGAGPVHAYGLAKKLGARRILVPPNAGVGSAMGFFTAPRAFDLVRSHKVSLEEVNFDSMQALFEEMEGEAASALGRDDGPQEIVFHRWVDARFVGQGSETRVETPERDSRDLSREILRQRFDEVYESLYGRTYPDSPLELVNFRVRASFPTRLLDLPILDPGGKNMTAARKGERQAYSAEAGDYVKHTVYDRYLLPPEATFDGPAIVEERESTVVVGSDGKARLDAQGFLWIELEGSR